jgi:hypothetical protein
MELTGYDTVIFSDSEPRQVFSVFLAALLHRWPNALVDLESEAGRLIGSHTLAVEAKMPEFEGQLLVFRDATMKDHCEQHGYTPMADGDGPVALWLRTREAVRFKFDNLDEIWSQPVQVGKVEPYSGWLCSSSIRELTIVTPDSPERDAFSMWAIETVLEAAIAR